MDLEHGSKKPSAAAPVATTSTSNTLLQPRDRLIAPHPIVLRASAVLATAAAAAAVMGLNTKSYTTVVAIVSTRPLTQTFAAKFTDTPAYFVIANAIAGAYNLAVLLTRRLTPRQRTASVVVRMLDMVIMVLLVTGAATAASMAYLGKNRNLHARWNPICDKFGSFCSRGGISLVSSFIGVALMLALNLFSTAANARRPNAPSG